MADLLQAVLLWLAANIDAWRGFGIALLALVVVGLVGLAQAVWDQL